VRTNAGIPCEILDHTAPLALGAIYVIASNPCDALAHVARDRLGRASA